MRIDKEDKYILNKAIFTFSQLLKQHVSGARYIDTEGLYFVYKKTTVVPLRYKKIKEVRHISGYGTVLDVHGVSVPIPIPGGFDHEGYVGLLEYMGGYILYDLPRIEKKKDSWRKV